VKLRIFQYIPTTRAEGPGLRACIQVQGCPIRCQGCAVPQTWPSAGGLLIETSNIIRLILAEQPHIEGVTFLGGEPFAQAAALAEIGQTVRTHGLSVVTFTGYLRESIEKADRNDFNELLEVTDLLIDGPFLREKIDFSRPWVGSTNQRFHFLTDRYLMLAAMLESMPNKIEVRLKPDGRILINGLAPIDDMRSLIQ
jgi:anaerobic ribonucleoside-triphosphate reductase activating protein